MSTNWWQKLSVSKKLYGVVGVMAFLIAAELFTLFFAMSTLSAVRAFVGGEGVWSKAQKNSVFYLHKYISTKDEKYYKLFQEQLEIPLGDHQARIEMEKEDMDEKKVIEGFIKGGNHPQDIPQMIKLVRKFHNVSHLAKALEKWRLGDDLIYKYIELAEEIHKEIKSPKRNKGNLEDLMKEVLILDAQLTKIENDFSYALGEASRWLEAVLMMILICAVITIEGTGLFLTFRFGQSLTKVLRELNKATVEVSKGNYSIKVPVKSKDELGELAKSINEMIEGLDKRTKEKQIAESASQSKNLFLANMSHEIRTPLNAILGFSSLLADDNVSEEDKKKFNEIIKRTGNTLNSIIKDVLDLSKIEADQVEIELSDFSLTQMMADLSVLLTLKSQEKGIGLRFEKVGEVSEYINSDPTRLRQILSNLIGNSIKFTKKGEVLVTYEAKDGFIYFKIKDSGIGISQKDQNNLFKPFSQADGSIRKSYGGTGLGLVISKKLSNLLGGDVTILESSDQGSTFCAKVEYVPKSNTNIKAPEKEVDKITDPESLKNKKVLLVDDVLDNQMLVQLFLLKTGAEVTFANNGQEALDLLSKNKYDIILMDMQMPVMDGYEATTQVRKTDKTTPIIALTGYAMKEDKEKCLEVGCNNYVSKPFEKNQLLSVIIKTLKS